MDRVKFQGQPMDVNAAVTRLLNERGTVTPFEAAEKFNASLTHIEEVFARMETAGFIEKTPRQPKGAVPAITQYRLVINGSGEYGS